MNVLNTFLELLGMKKTPDDKLAIYLMSKVNKSTLIERSHYASDAYQFTIDNKVYECFYDSCKVDGLIFKSKRFTQLFNKLGTVYNLIKLNKIHESIAKEKIKKNIEFKLALQTHGGIEKILDNINTKNLACKLSNGKFCIVGDWFCANSPINTDERTHINSISINLKTLDVTMHRSYGALSDYRKFEGKIKNLEEVQKYLDILNNQSKEEYKNKQEFINTL